MPFQAASDVNPAYVSVCTLQASPNGVVNAMHWRTMAVTYNVGFVPAQVASSSRAAYRAAIKSIIVNHTVPSNQKEIAKLVVCCSQKPITQSSRPRFVGSAMGSAAVSARVLAR